MYMYSAKFIHVACKKRFPWPLRSTHSLISTQHACHLVVIVLILSQKKSLHILQEKAFLERGDSSGYHRLRGLTSPVLTATHHSYRSPRLSDFFPAHPWRSDPPTDLHTKWLDLRKFSLDLALTLEVQRENTPYSSRD